MRCTLGLDVSTQSISAVVVDVDEARVVAEHSLAYRRDERLNRFGIDFESLVCPPREPGEADQPPLMFLAGLDAIFADLAKGGAPLGDLVAIAVSAQQHGHVYLGKRGIEAIRGLGSEAGGGLAGGTSLGDGVASRAGGPPLADRFRDAFAYGTAPIWQSAQTGAEADAIRRSVGGREAVVELSGSDSPLRFTGAVARHVGSRFPDCWQRTEQLSLLSSFISAVLAANPETPIDWGNGSGMSLMDYRSKEWAPALVAAVGDALPEGPGGLRRRLPTLAAPTTIAGTVAPYFSSRYGIPADCLVTIGSGDNPQSKIMAAGDLLSLGSSFVLMVDTGEPRVDVQGYANSMYDGLGRPFVFACRTNGALVWDRVRARFGADLAAADAALESTEAGSSLVVWQPYADSYPVAPPIDAPDITAGRLPFERAYAGVVDSALALTWHFARGFDTRGDTLAVTGGPSASRAILERIAAIWRRPVVPVGAGGAALGASLSAAVGRGEADGRAVDVARLRDRLVPPGRTVEPDPAAVARYHGEDGYLERLIPHFEERRGANV